MKNLIHNLNTWANRNTNISLDILRVMLGVFLFLKGVQFAGQTEILVDLINPKSHNTATIFLAHYVAMAHLAGGILVAFGLLTRLALAIQFPILIGAVLINFTGELVEWNLLQAMFGLVVGGFFLFYGSGKHSVDYSLQLHV